MSANNNPHNWDTNSKPGHYIFNGEGEPTTWWDLNQPFLTTFGRDGDPDIRPIFNLERYPMNVVFNKPLNPIYKENDATKGILFPEVTEADASLFTKHNAWGLNFLFQHTTLQVASSYRHTTSAADAKSILVNKYDMVPACKIVGLLRKLFKTELVNCTDVNEYLDIVTSAAADLELHNIKIEDNVLAYNIVDGISTHPDLAHIADQLTLARPKNAPKLSTKEVLTTLRTKTQFIKQQDQHQANAANRGISPPSSTQGQGHHHCATCASNKRCSNHPGDTCYWVVPCTRCGQLGHKAKMKEKCPKYVPQKQDQNSGSGSGHNAGIAVMPDNKAREEVSYYLDAEMFSKLQIPIAWNSPPSIVHNHIKFLIHFAKFVDNVVALLDTNTDCFNTINVVTNTH
jgi:hypothetical protein